MHDVPHVPQLNGSRPRLAQPVPHIVSLEAHVGAHLPSVQTFPPWHGAPHAPQLAGSFCVSRHEVPHFVVPPTQTQALMLQNPPAPHCVPHAPQLDGSFTMFTQRALVPLPHGMVVPVHEVWHPPMLHTEVGPQMVPHPPQLFGSLCVSTHAEPHTDSDGIDGVHWHFPATQMSGAPQTVPHVPQLFESELVMLHRAEAPEPHSA